MLNGATWAGVGAIGLWAFLALLNRAAADLPPLQLTAMAFAVSASCGIGWLAASGRLGELRQSPAAWLHGVGGLFGYHALYFAALALAPPAEANLINYMWPLMIVLLSAALLGLRLTRRHVAGTVLALAGCALLLGGGASFRADAAAGYALALCGGFAWALYSVTARWFPGVPSGAVAGFCAGAAGLAAAAHLAFEATASPDPAAWLAVLALGLGPLGAAFALWDAGMKRGDIRLLGTLAFATPVASTLLLAAAGHAPFTASLAAAAALVAAGGLTASRG